MGRDHHGEERRKGQPTTFYATLAREPIRLNCELKHVNVVLSPDQNVFRHSNPFAGLTEGGVFIIQNDLPAAELWRSLPQGAQREIRDKGIRVFYLDAFQIATEEATDPELRYRMQGTAFMGAFFKASPLAEREGLSEEQLIEGIRAQLKKKFGHLGERVVEDNVRVIKRGFDEVQEMDPALMIANDEDEVGMVPLMPDMLDGSGWRDGIGNPGRFWEQVCHLYKTGQDGIADPFAAISAIPAATSTIRDMTDVRFEVPEFIAENCTGCAQCWVQCPDSAIPGVVNEIDEVIEAAIKTAENGQSFDRLRQITKHLSREARKVMKGVPFTTFGDVLSTSYKAVIDKLGPDPERRKAMDAEFAPVYSALAEFPLAKTGPFFDLPESKEKGTGGLLSITINPEACKGCDICVNVCPDNALKTVKQDDEVVDKLRRNWTLWKNLPDTQDRYINVANLEEGIGVLPSLLLKKENYMSMVGGDGSCMGCGEKTGIHLILSAVNALMLPRVARYVQKLDDLIERLDAKARTLLASDADLDDVRAAKGDQVDIPIDQSKKNVVDRITQMIHELKDLRWRYTEGPSGRGRATAGFANATGCSSVWGSTYPYNPYPLPWVNHLFQDAPSIAIGIFEGNMRKMANGFAALRRAELEVEDNYDAAEHEPFFAKFDWEQFTDDEFAMCPPVFAVGGDGAMLDIGFQNLSRLMASGKPIRVIVLDTQVYSNTGGQACTSGFLGQVSDMAAFGPGQHGKEEMRKELALIAMAHRGTYVLQASQASASHLLGGVLRGLQSKRPAVFLLHCPCPPEHGIADDAAPDAAKLAVESRAFPVLSFDPDAGSTLADCIDLDGNPSVEDVWPSYDLTYVDEGGAEQTMSLPITIADWAATEARFRKHFKKVKGDASDEDLVPFHEYMELSAEDREDKTPFVWSIDSERHLQRLMVSNEVVRLTEDRLLFWAQLKEMAGLQVTDSLRSLVEDELETKFEEQAQAIRTEYEAKLADLKARYPAIIARRMAEGLIRAGNGGEQTVGEILARAQSMPGLAPMPPGGDDLLLGGGGAGPAVATAPAPAAATAAPAEAPAAVEEEEELGMEPYIESARCTSCDECTNINSKMFAYDKKKLAYIKDAKAGTFKQLVQSAEKCPVQIIHPGTPLNPKEKDLAKWVKRAEPFN
jgi:pyruvate-ferredoxin/flavodoxin oxidoreductase